MQGRFTAPDEFFKDSKVGDPQSWNKYAYVRGNPLKYIDPTGEKATVKITTDEERKTGTITINVDWRESGTRTKLFYTVEFKSSTDKKLGKKKGACWENELKMCASQIVKQAKIAARKLNRVK